LFGPNNLVVPFVACGDLSGYDADQSYPLLLKKNDVEVAGSAAAASTYIHKEPCQKPINPQYHTYLNKTQKKRKTAVACEDSERNAEGAKDKKPSH
jgi:tRNA (cytidine32/guanosine34-2'-O)-methyltransferase